MSSSIPVAKSQGTLMELQVEWKAISETREFLGCIFLCRLQTQLLELICFLIPYWYHPANLSPSSHNLKKNFFFYLKSIMLLMYFVFDDLGHYLELKEREREVKH